jgi:hypothetical protein
MKKVLAFIKLWGGKIFTLICKKSFLEVFPIVVFLLASVFTGSLLLFICALIQFVGCISNGKKEE